MMSTIGNEETSSEEKDLATETQQAIVAIDGMKG